MSGNSNRNEATDAIPAIFPRSIPAEAPPGVVSTNSAKVDGARDGDIVVPHPRASFESDMQASAEPSALSRMGLGPDKPLSTEGRYVQAGQELAALFKDKRVHPVIIVGGSGTGKTTLLASLFRYLRFTEGSGCVVNVMRDLYPAGHDFWQRQLEQAEQLVETTVVGFSQSNAPPSTLIKEPFFIPVTVRKSDNEEIRLAFMESSGELYQLEKSGSSPHKRFHALLGSLLNSFTDPVSIIYVAPLVSGEATANGALESSQTKEMVERDIAMFGVMNQYTEQRKGAYHNDRHLLLMTKWDVQFKTLSEPDLVDPFAERIADAFRERYPKTWALFSQLPFQEGTGKKRFAVYSAGAMFESRVLAASAADRPRLDRFPRKLWHWLWKSASGGILYPPEEPRKPNLLDRMVAWLQGR